MGCNRMCAALSAVQPHLAPWSCHFLAPQLSPWFAPSMGFRFLRIGVAPNVAGEGFFCVFSSRIGTEVDGLRFLAKVELSFHQEDALGRVSIPP